MLQQVHINGAASSEQRAEKEKKFNQQKAEMKCKIKFKFITCLVISEYVIISSSIPSAIRWNPNNTNNITQSQLQWSQSNYGVS